MCPDLRHKFVYSKKTQNLMIQMASLIMSLLNKSY